jgi:hypothetical protein
LLNGIGIDPAKYNGGAAFTQIILWNVDRLELKSARVFTKQITDIIDVGEKEPGRVIPISIDHK